MVCSLAALIGNAWLAESFESSWVSWLNIQILGMIAATGLAFGAVVTDTRRRWPAAAALVCLAPMGQALLGVVSMLPSILRLTGLAGLLTIAGSVSAICVAIYILVTPPPPIPTDPIPRARST
jgi:cytochrome bd-type quinol oxidase subunit 2